MKVSEWFWTRIGFGVVVIAAGFIWFMIFSPVITIINPDASGSAAAKVFMAVFLLVSFIAGVVSVIAIMMLRFFCC